MKKALKVGRVGLWLGTVSLAAMVIAAPGYAQEQALTFHIKAQALPSAIIEYSRQSGAMVVADASLTAGKTSTAVDGAFTSIAALTEMLKGTGLTAVAGAKGGLILVKAVADVEEPTNVVVTGSRIRGAPPSAPVIAITAEDMKNAGQSTIAEAMLAVPQNFGGGQNQNVGVNQGANNWNLNGSSTINLRGMGSDATLTLLNGNRLSSSALSNAIDVSSIPVAAVSRVEILADGASALYGSDAIAGVANIVLKKDYDGLNTTARVGTSTDGGNTQAEVSVTSGKTWRGGGMIGVYDFADNEPTYAKDRTYTTTMNPEAQIMPLIHRHSIIVSAHQTLSDNISVATDMGYKWGDNQPTLYGTSATLPIHYSGSGSSAKSETFVIDPSITVALPGGWKSKTTVSYGYDKSTNFGFNWINGALAPVTSGHYNNQFRAIETSAEGGLFELPGGDSRLAVGAGYRWNQFDGTNTYQISNAREDYFAYGELFLPFVSQAQNMPLVNKLNATVAVRWEDYPHLKSIMTPKVGLIYSPVDDLTLKASWGKSFKAPTLYQLGMTYQAILLKASSYNASYPAGSSVLALFNGNPDLKPERSDSTTLTAEYQPKWAPGLKTTVSYFSVDYTNKIVVPFSSISSGLNNPAYASLLALNPTPAQVQTLLTGALDGVYDLTGSATPYDTTAVAVILDDRNRNAAKQTYRGVDLDIDYRFEPESGQTLTLSGAATYLASEQFLGDGEIAIPLAGTLFNPAHFRARAGATWQRGDLTLSSFVNYVGGVNDNRTAAAVHIHGMTTFDEVARVKLNQGLELSLSALNLFNAKPQQISQTTAYNTSYDSTNYSAVGRYIGLSVSKDW